MAQPRHARAEDAASTGTRKPMSAATRICSLLPSATEIVYALGLEDSLVAVTHECDYPPEAAAKPRITSSVIDSDGLSAREIDQAVRESLAEQATIYQLDRDLLDELAPDLILTQELCDVCAVGTSLVQDAVRSLRNVPQVVALEPRTLDEVFESILLVGRLTGRERPASDLVHALGKRVAAVGNAVAAYPKRRVLTLEWLDPPFVGGHWVPEMVDIAGGCDVLGRAGEYSREVSWNEIAEARPDAVLAMPCGFGLGRTVQELANAPLPTEWEMLPAVQNGQVYALDGSSYFNRPGPRLVDGVEILAAILHPGAVSGTPPNSWAHVPAVHAATTRSAS